MNGKNDIWKDEQVCQLADVLASIGDLMKCGVSSRCHDSEGDY